MSLHDDIQQKISVAIEQADARGVRELSPSWIAQKVYQQYRKPSDDMHVQYACIEHFKQMARKCLADNFNPDSNESHAYQGELFSGSLQARYPIPRKRGEEPIYKPLNSLSDSEFDWNIDQLTKSADARVKHADALRAYKVWFFSQPHPVNEKAEVAA